MALIMKFSSKECKQKANTAIKDYFEQDPQFLVFEPRKLIPKMTVVGIPVSLSGGEITTIIAEKSIDIKELLNKGCTLQLCFSK